MTGTIRFSGPSSVNGIDWAAEANSINGIAVIAPLPSTNNHSGRPAEDTTLSARPLRARRSANAGATRTNVSPARLSIASRPIWRLDKPYRLQLEGEEQCDPRRLPAGHGQDHDGDRGEPERNTLGNGGLLSEDEHTDRHRRERCDEVAQSGLDHPVVHDRPDVAAPVHGEQAGGNDQPEHRPAFAEGLTKLWP